MNDIEKLKTLLHHWREHNNEHAETYRKWSEKISSLGNKELSEILGQLYHQTKKINELFEEAIKKIQ